MKSLLCVVPDDAKGRVGRLKRQDFFPLENIVYSGVQTGKQVVTEPQNEKYDSRFQAPRAGGVQGPRKFRSKRRGGLRV